MKNFKKLVASFVMCMSLLAINPIVAHAEWRQDSNGWWNTEGSSWSVGWRQIDGKWYYFNADGYMAHDTTIEGYYLNSNGAWINNVAAQNSTSYNSNSSSSASKQYVDSNGQGLIKGSKSKIYHVPNSKYYDKTTNVVQWFKTVEEAENAGYRAPEK
ncbi:hypothetical protein B0P06_003475 [Clostridium saccharoperbutylacetonicum]|uniref:Cell wall binding repeat-containing protein n=1 Tax=Clostridium saccharoperbutylacetonicum N1-4(HMT) TaxID=931276 RepID=M1N434_9CLOT|nr:hypothetical protein [Clostridium saccharoperbutylacetonicum]AGF58212.1 hypothetical protein Cspa_c44590 [Clostridium saccharoperbutylacetonicum N1-4(HMT)]NRT61013.1 hypothetical protein [Clostridium saccharoperbutylacetonicum]NSB24328.1 hypothetical protein [Clostridium saccharoperbutylacetonicum]NSB43704.1 hypothetical protein [Clostridium saccharoperbutylacetonicum]